MHVLLILLAAVLEVFAAYQWAKWHVLDRESITVILLKRKGKVPEFKTYKLWGLVSLPVIIFGLSIIFLISGYEFYLDAPHWYVYLSLLWTSPESASGYQFTYGKYLVPGMLVISFISLWGAVRTLRNWKTNTMLTYLDRPPEQTAPPQPTHLRVIK
jgi:hypothetical protein